MSKINKLNSYPVNIKIVGLILSESYQQCKSFVSKLSKYHHKRFSPPSIQGLLESDWSEYLAKLRKNSGGQTWAVQKGVVVFINNKFIGSEDELFERFKEYESQRLSSEEIKSIAKREYMEYLNRANLLYTYLELSLGGHYMGSLLFELRSDLFPKSALRFATLCDPENRLGFSYKGSTVHRVCKSGWLQAGNVDEKIGLLEDESLCYKHDRRGVLSFCNNGKHKNTAQFFVTFNPAAWMDEFYVAFGRVVEGSDVLRRIENTECFYESPIQEILITNCGLVEAGMGTHLPTKLKMKGLTIGAPHIDLDTFIDLILDNFCDVLFEGLDGEIKRAFHAEWIGNMIWEMVKPTLRAREPVDDVQDNRDNPSDILLMDSYLKGLYNLQDIPDHYIMSILNTIISDVVEKSEVSEMAKSIMNVILGKITYRESGDIAADNFLKELIKRVNDIIFGPESSDLLLTGKEDHSETGFVRKGISRIRSESFNSFSLGTGPMSESTSTFQEPGSFPAIRKTSSTKESIVKFVIESLLESISTPS